MMNRECAGILRRSGFRQKAALLSSDIFAARYRDAATFYERFGILQKHDNSQDELLAN